MSDHEQRMAEFSHAWTTNSPTLCTKCGHSSIGVTRLCPVEQQNLFAYADELAAKLGKAAGVIEAARFVDDKKHPTPMLNLKGLRLALAEYDRELLDHPRERGEGPAGAGEEHDE